jgi:hypothetical protein
MDRQPYDLDAAPEAARELAVGDLVWKRGTPFDTQTLYDVQAINGDQVVLVRHEPITFRRQPNPNRWPWDADGREVEA